MQTGLAIGWRAGGWGLGALVGHVGEGAAREAMFWLQAVLGGYTTEED